MDDREYARRQALVIAEIAGQLIASMSDDLSLHDSVCIAADYERKARDALRQNDVDRVHLSRERAFNAKFQHKGIFDEIVDLAWSVFQAAEAVVDRELDGSPSISSFGVGIKGPEDDDADRG
jgi:hypothetical protein